MNKIEVVGAIASKTGATLFLKNGGELHLRSDSCNTADLLKEIAPVLAKRKIAEIDLDRYSATSTIERKSNGLIRFFRRQVEKIGQVFSGTNLIIDSQGSLRPDETLVAVVDGTEIPGVEALENYITDAAYGESYPGFEKFMQRLAAVISKRRHTADELLNFMHRGDLPIADDGSIVAYKILKQSVLQSQYPGFTWVDKHSGNVPQRVGTLVTMREDLVDPSRRTECSTGLHIARRAYLRGFFSGVDAITIVKVAPEDVIAVPNGEPDKMRAASYHICAELPQECYSHLLSDKPMTEHEEAALLLGKVLRGDHVGILETVKIGGAYGGNITIERNGAVVLPVKRATEAAPARAFDDPNRPQGKEIDVKGINKVVREQSSINLAAASGDMAAALNATEPAKVVEKVSAAPAKPKENSAPKVKSVAPAAPKSDLSERDQKALKMHNEGASMRTIAAELKMCRKTLRKLIDANK